MRPNCVGEGPLGRPAGQARDGAIAHWQGTARQPDSNPVGGSRRDALDRHSDGLARWVQGKLERLPLTDPLADLLVLTLLEDREGNLWVGTDSDGLHIFARFALQNLRRARKAGFRRDDDGDGGQDGNALGRNLGQRRQRAAPDREWSEAGSLVERAKRPGEQRHPGAGQDRTAIFGWELRTG